MSDHTRRSFIGAAGLALGGTVFANTELSGAEAALDPDSQPESDWPMVGRGPHRTGFNPQGASFAEVPLVDWSQQVTDFGLGPDPNMEVGQAVVDGVVYFGGSSGTEDESRGVVTAVDLEDGAPRWRTELEEPASYPGVGSESVYVASDGRLLAFSRADGTLRWSKRISDRFLSVPAVVDGTVYTSTVGDADPPSTYAFEAASGEQQWQAEIGTDYGLTSRVAVDGDMVFVGSTALSATDGSVIWGEAENTRTEAVSMVAGDSVIVVGATSDSVRALDRTDGSTRWATGIEGPDVQLPTAAPARYDDLVVVPTYAQVGGGGGRVTALDRSDGSVAWSIDPDGGAPGSVASGDGVVYLTVSPNFYTADPDEREPGVWALDPENGSVLWTLPMRGSAMGIGMEVRSGSAVAPVSDAVVLTDGDGYAYALTRSDSEVGWRFDAAGPVRSALAVTDPTVFAADTTGTFYAVDVESGETQWQTQGGSATAGLGIVAAGDQVITISDGLSGFDVQTGATKWSLDTGGRLARTAVDGTVYIAPTTDKANVLAIDAETGDTRWSSAELDVCPSLEVAAPPVVAGDTVYVARNSGGTGRIFALDRSDGSQIWTTETDEELSSLAAAGDGVYYVQDWYGDSTIYALDGADGSARWAFDLDEWAPKWPDTTHSVKSLTATEASVYATSIERSEEETEDPIYTGFLHAFDANGTHRWSLDIDSSSAPVVDTPPVVVDDTVFATGNWRLYAVNSADGAVVERFETTGSIRSTPAISSDSAFVGNDDASLYRFHRP